MAMGKNVSAQTNHITFTILTDVSSMNYITYLNAMNLTLLTSPRELIKDRT
jgi:hypothetical protein